MSDDKYKKADGSFDWAAYVKDHEKELERELKERAERVRNGTWNQE